MTPDSSGKIVLVVEDNPQLNLAIGEILESYGYVILSAANGLEALEILQKQLPDVILCDIAMPGMDGYTLLKHTRASAKWRTLPFLFLTARASIEDQRRAKGIGVEDYLIKPFDEEHLVTAIQNALRRREIMKEEMQRQMDGLRNQIVGILQHEFRTPLTFVLGYAEYLQASTQDEIDIDDLRTSTAAILEGGQRLQRLIESFLLLADLQNRKLKTENLSNFDVTLVWQEVMLNFMNELSESGMDVHVDETTDAVIKADVDLVREALGRLMDNAIRYKRPESKNIWLSAIQTETHVGLRIRDESQGIPAERLAWLLRPFAQVDRDNRTQPGAGLSLSLIQHVAHAHGGSLEIESVVGEGTTATLWIPQMP
ncbi:MAG: response regulator [Chloroflexota bacterium]